jgi:choline kinase
MTAPARTVILAAGYGSRLGSAESGVPKPLLTIAGQPLIAHALEHARLAGCSDAVIVIGHQGDRVQAAVEALPTPLKLHFVENPDVDTPNGLSLLAAETVSGDWFYLQMVDHVFGGVALAELTRTPLAGGEAGRVLVDARPPAELDIADATRVRLSGGRVTAIGKQLEPWDAIDAGCFVLTRAVFDALRSVPPGEPLTVSSGMRRLAAAGRLGAADVNSTPWIDVDTPADRAAAERLLMTSLARTP